MDLVPPALPLPLAARRTDGNNIIRNGVINFGAHLVDRQEYRQVFRGVIWIALFICALMDGALGDYLISGPDHFSDVLCWNCPPTPLKPSDWIFTGVFLVFQALLILVLIRTRRNGSQMVVVQIGR